MVITVGQRYTHYKRGGDYEVIHIGFLQSDTVDDGKEVVVYKQQHDHTDYPAGTVWVRTVEMFVSTTKHGTPRFQLLP